MGNDCLIELMKQEIAPALGCTEPAAIGLAVAKSKETLGKPVGKICLYLSRNMLKNAMGVGIPGTDEVGIEMAAALACVAGHSEYLLEVFRDVKPEDIKEARTFMEASPIQMEVADTDEKLYIRAVCQADGDEAETIIKRSHTNIVMVTHNGHCLYLQKEECDRQVNQEQKVQDLPVAEIYRFVKMVPVEEIQFLQESVDMNLAIAKEGIREKYGLGVGRQTMLSMEPTEREEMEKKAVSLAAAAADARMAGCPLPVMSTTGSGNQGITATVPVAVVAESLGKSQEEMLRAIALSQLVTIHIKASLGKLSALCGCAIAAGIGAACGLTYLYGGEEPQVESAIRNMVADISGLICDGAKYGCALKIATSVSSAFRCADLAVHDVTASGNDGIVSEDVEQTIQNLAALGNRGMADTDKLILNMMIQKQ